MDLPIQKVQNKDNGDIYFFDPNKPRRFIDGEEFIIVKRELESKLEFYIKRKPLIMNVK